MVLFPASLDDATVLFYTEYGDFGTVKYSDETECAEIKYLAICQYLKDDKVYLFSCDGSFDVIGDSVWDSVDECKAMAAQTQKDISWHKK